MKQRLFLFAVSILSLLLLNPFFHIGVPTTHDSENHLARFAAYYHAFADGQFPPRWAGTLNFTYGSPVLNFFYPLPGYIGSFLHFLGISYEGSFNLIMLLSFFTSGYFFYLFMRFFFTREVACIGGILFAFAPYHLLNVYVRGDIGETMALTLIPLVFFFLERIIRKVTIRDILLGGVSFGMVILSHNGVSLMFTPVLLLYIFVRNAILIKHIFSSFLLLGMGFLLSFFFWFPALMESKYTNITLFVGDIYKNHFLPISKMFLGPWHFGADVNSLQGLSPQLGLVITCLGLASIFVAFTKKKLRKESLFWLGILVLALFLTSAFSQSLWQELPLIKNYQFPWRFMGLASFAAVVLSCSVLSQIKNQNILILITLLFLISSLGFAKVPGYTQRNDRYYDSFPGTTYYHGEASTIWTAGDATHAPQKKVEFIEGKGRISDMKRKSQLHEYSITAENNAKIVDNTVFYPGWIVRVDNQIVPVEFQDPSYRGLITFAVPKGKHTVQVQFIETTQRKLSDLLSLVTWIGVLFSLLYPWYKKLPLLRKAIKHYVES